MQSIKTSDGRNITVDSSVTWSISSPSLYVGFSNRNGGQEATNGIIEKRLRDLVSDYIGGLSYEEVTKTNTMDVLNGFQMALTEDASKKFQMHNAGISIYHFTIINIHENYTTP
jgi:regulator of protease activity HflC (stomatin/prohibitin superfamily)